MIKIIRALTLSLTTLTFSFNLSATESLPQPKPASTPDLIQERSPVSTERLLNAEQEPQNWLSHGRTYDEKRYSPLKQINDSTVQQLGLSWSYEFLDKRVLEATPLVVDGVMYTTAAWSHVYALNAKTGELLWHYDPQVPKAMGVRGCCGPANRGVAVWQDNVYVGTYDGYLVALNRHSGEVVWRVLTIDAEKDYTITGAPRVVKGNVLIGNGGAELGVRGYLTAYDAVTGELKWRFYTVPGNPADGFENDTMKKIASTWNGEWWKIGGGGTVWDSLSFDPKLNLLYIGVGNGSPWNQKIRSPAGGDNLFLSSIVALDPDTGKYVWHYQTTPGESWDFTATQQMILADIEWQGKPRQVLMQAPKNGFFFILDRTTGEFLSAEPFTPVKWATGYDAKGRPIETAGARYLEDSNFMFPSAFGAHNWHSMSYSPDTGLVYIPVMQGSLEYKQPENYAPKPHHTNVGIDLTSKSMISPSFMQIFKNKLIQGELVAWDPIKQQAAWRVKHNRSWNGGTLSTAGNLVFQGTADHHFNAYDAQTGKELWNYNTHLGIVAAPITYSIDDEQYVAIMAKLGGGLPLPVGIEPIIGLEKGRLLVFKLNGSASLPPPDELAVTLTLPPPMPTADETSIDTGKRNFTHYCSSCHGMEVVAGGNVPDLRHMDAGRHQAFKAIVLDGILQGNGMVSFRDVLDEKQVDQIYAYILQQAHAEYDEQQVSSTWKEIRIQIYDKLAELLVWLLAKT